MKKLVKLIMAPTKPMAIGNRYFSLMFFNIVIGSLLPQRIDTPERSSDSDSPARGGRGEESEALAARLRLLSVRLSVPQ